MAVLTDCRSLHQMKISSNMGWSGGYKARALKRADVKSEYDQLDKEFAFLDEFLKARSSAGITQAEVAARIGTTQSAIARLESGSGKHSPSLATLQKYAHALGCRLELRLINEMIHITGEGRTIRSTGHAKVRR